MVNLKKSEIILPAEIIKNKKKTNSTNQSILNGVLQKNKFLNFYQKITIYLEALENQAKVTLVKIKASSPA